MAARKKEDGGEIRKALGLDKNQCLFCMQSEDNEDKYGRYIKRFGLTLHYFCMLFASGLSQRGESDEDGISGFLPSDVLKELKRGLRLRCIFCKCKGATIGCVVGKCRAVFHYSCGIQNNTLHQFFDTFSSYCSEHRPQQIECLEEDTEVMACAICMTSVVNRPSNETLKSPCCRGSWFHRTCIQKHATTAGMYFFKCPLCNNKDDFQKEMLRMGVHIPDQDAAWETEPNAFTDLLVRYLHCDAYKCRCDKGRDYNKDGGKWEILVCDWCGSTGSHVGCHNIIKVGPDDYMCPDCFDIEQKLNKCNGIKKKKKGTKKLPSPRANRRQDDPSLENKGKSEYQQQANGFKKVTTPLVTSGVMSEDELSSSDGHMLNPGNCNMSAMNQGSLDSPEKHESTCISLSKCSGKQRLHFNTQQRSPNIMLSAVTKKQIASKTVVSGDEEVDVVGLEDKAESQAQSLLKKISPEAAPPPQRKGYAYIDDPGKLTREGRRLKRKKQQNDSLRKRLGLDIDMLWADVDSSDSESEYACRPKKLRKRNSVRNASCSSVEQRKTRTKASATVTSRSEQTAESENGTAMECDVGSLPVDKDLSSKGEEASSCINESANINLVEKPKISLNQDLDSCVENSSSSDVFNNSSDYRSDKSISKLTLKRSFTEQSRKKTNRKYSKGKIKYKMNPNQMLIKQWLQKSNSQQKVEEKAEPPAEDMSETIEKPQKTTLKIRFKGKTFMFKRHIKPSTSFKENLRAGESTVVNFSKQLSPEMNGQQWKQQNKLRLSPWKSIDPLASPPDGIAESMDLWKEAKRMVYTERKKYVKGQRHLRTPRTFPTKKRRSAAIESLIRFPDDTIHSYEEEHIYYGVSNLNVKCSLAKKFDYSEINLKPMKGNTTSTDGSGSSTDMSTLTFIDSNTCLNDSSMSMPKLSPIEMDEGVIIMRDKNSGDPQVSPVGDTHHCMVVNLQPDTTDIHKRATSGSSSPSDQSETNGSDEKGQGISSSPQRLVTVRKNSESELLATSTASSSDDCTVLRSEKRVCLI